jgi:hypothetical protein
MQRSPSLCLFMKLQVDYLQLFFFIKSMISDM